MGLTRRGFLKGALFFAGAVIGPWSLSGRTGSAASGDVPALGFLARSEYRFINDMAREMIPDEPVLSGLVDVAKNIDYFFAKVNYAPDFLVMFRLLRLIRIADPVLPLLKKISAATHEDIISFKRTICFLGYYSDANGEADMPAEQRIVWKRIGYGGPKPEDWWPPESEMQLDRSLLRDRVKEEGA